MLACRRRRGKRKESEGKTPEVNDTPTQAHFDDMDIALVDDTATSMTRKVRPQGVENSLHKSHPGAWNAEQAKPVRLPPVGSAAALTTESQLTA